MPEPIINLPESEIYKKTNTTPRLIFDFFNPCDLDFSEFFPDEKTKKIGQDESEKIPQDNVGRETCFLCGRPTIKKPLFSTSYDYCEYCKK